MGVNANSYYFQYIIQQTLFSSEDVQNGVNYIIFYDNSREQHEMRPKAFLEKCCELVIMLNPKKRNF